MQIREITEVKDHLDQLVKEGVAKAWELPYENILTRRSAAIFFVEPVAGIEGVAEALGKYPHFSYRKNEEQTLSDLPYRITFSQEEKEINLNQQTITS